MFHPCLFLLDIPFYTIKSMVPYGIYAVHTIGNHRSGFDSTGSATISPPGSRSGSALKTIPDPTSISYGSGFAFRSKIRMNLKMNAELGALPGGLDSGRWRESRAWSRLTESLSTIWISQSWVPTRYSFSAYRRYTLHQSCTVPVLWNKYERLAKESQHLQPVLRIRIRILYTVESGSWENGKQWFRYFFYVDTEWYLVVLASPLYISTYLYLKHTVPYGTVPTLQKVGWYLV